MVCSEKRTLLSARLLNLGGEANTDEAVVRLELLQRLGRVIDKGKSSGLATTELSPQAEDVDLVFCCLVEGGELVAKLILRYVGTAWVQNVTVLRIKARSVIANIRQIA